MVETNVMKDKSRQMVRASKLTVTLETVTPLFLGEAEPRGNLDSLMGGAQP